MRAYLIGWVLALVVLVVGMGDFILQAIKEQHGVG